MGRKAYFFAVAMAATPLGFLSCTGPPPTTAKVLLIGIDGVRPDILAKVPTPNLDRLASEGAFSAVAQTGLPTVSGPSWSSMLTGVWSSKHGVVDNSFEGKNYEAFPDFLTRVERATPERHTIAVADWTPLVSEEGGGPLIGDGPDEVVVLNGYELGWQEADEEVTRVAVDRLTNADPDAMFVYLGNPDEISHATSSIGTPYETAIAEADGQVGRLLAAMEARPTYDSERWLVLVSTDHGRTEDGGHGGDTEIERTIFYLAWGAGVAPGAIPGTPQIVDVATTALSHLGIDIDPQWELDGRVVGLEPSVPK